MIVWCCGMSRSGGTVQYQIAQGLVERSGLGGGVGHKWQPFIRKDPIRWVVIKREEFGPRGVRRVVEDKDRSRVVGIHRDPRAVAASLLVWRRKQGRDPTVVDVWLETQLALRWYRGWTPYLDYAVSYEEAIRDWGAVAIGINHALGLCLSNEECREVTGEWTVDKNLERVGDQERWLDPKTLLTREHITGAGHQWIDVLPVSLLAWIEWFYSGWMERYGYNCVLGGASKEIYRRSPNLGAQSQEV